MLLPSLSHRTSAILLLPFWQLFIKHICIFILCITEASVALVLCMCCIHICGWHLFKKIETHAFCLKLTKVVQQFRRCLYEFDPTCVRSSAFFGFRAKRSFSSCRKTWWRFLMNSTRWARLIRSHRPLNLFLDYFFILSLRWRVSRSGFIIPSIRNSPGPLSTLSRSFFPRSLRNCCISFINLSFTFFCFSFCVVMTVSFWFVVSLFGRGLLRDLA